MTTPMLSTNEAVSRISEHLSEATDDYLAEKYLEITSVPMTKPFSALEDIEEILRDASDEFLINVYSDIMDQDILILEY